MSVGGDEVLAAVLDVLRVRMPAVLDVLNESAPLIADFDTQGRKSAEPVLLDPVRQWRVVADFSASSDGQLPQVAVDSPGFAPPTPRASAGSAAPRVSAGSITWSVLLTVLQRGQFAAHTLMRTQRYVTALQDTILGASPLLIADRSCDVQVVAAAYDEVEPEQRRTLGAGFLEVTVNVPNAVDLSAVPSDQPAPVPVNRALVTVTRRRPPP